MPLLRANGLEAATRPATRGSVPSHRAGLLLLDRSDLRAPPRRAAGRAAERAGRELVATGETARTRAVESRDELTPHQVRIARMARDGASNQEIATQLFVSRKTVESHLRRVFQKLGIGKREAPRRRARRP